MQHLVDTPQVCGIVGDPVAASLSPLIHNAGYLALGIDRQYRYAPFRVDKANLPAALAGMRALGIRGFSVTMPHKEAIIPLLDRLDPAVTAIGAANTVVNDNGTLTGFNTDWLGIARPVQALGLADTAHVVVLGSGGAARAAAFALHQLNLPTTIVARSIEAGATIASLFNQKSIPWAALADLKDVTLVINTTPIGMHPNQHQSPVPRSFWNSSMVAFDTVYIPRRTAMLDDASTAGASIICGTSMLLEQAYEQFRLFTGREAPTQAMESAIEATAP